MRDFPTELLELATRLQESAPRELEDPKSWMKEASDFAGICLPNGQLAPQLIPVIPLADQGQFQRAVKAIGAAAGSYNSGLRPNIDNGLALITKILGREVVIEGSRGFMIGSVRERVSKLSTPQKQILDATWNHYVKTTQPLPIRSVQPLIGKRALREVLSGLNGSLITETQDGNTRCLSLSLFGAFLTGHGNVLANLLVACLELAKELYTKNSDVAGFTSEQVRERLGVESTLLLVRLLRIGLPPRFPFYVSGMSNDGSSWSVTIGDEVMDLYQSNDTVAYLDGLLSSTYRENEPIFLEERQKQYAPNAAALDQLLGTTTLPQPARPAAVTPGYIDLARLRDLTGADRKQFDCTRLIVMCEELNECASRGNAHAVIMLTRAILDHVPPAFGFKSFAQLAANYGGDGEKSFKKAMERLDKHTKEVAHRLLHGHISKSEVAPTMSEVSYPGELNTLLSELYRRLK
jgi:hypothetical protein